MHQSGLEIDLQGPGLDGERLLRSILARPERPRTKRGELRCQRHGGDLYLQVRSGSVVACHRAGSGQLSEHRVALMSTEHRVQVDYIARAGEKAGLEVNREMSLPTRVRPDVVVNSAAFEVQRSQITVPQAKRRTTQAVRGGMTVSLWLSDKDPKYSPKWLGIVPSVRIWAPDWLRLPSIGSAQVTGGLRRLLPVRCPPHGSTCLLTDRGTCQGWHLEHVPLGSGQDEHSADLSLDHLAVTLAIGNLVPVQLGKWVMIVEGAQAEKYGLTWSPPQARQSVRRSDDRIRCQTAPSTSICCGGHFPGAAGDPLVLACQLCPNSPTYWRAA
jgi:hypothetical protein